MKKIAITGTIGSGKSTVAILLRRKHFPVFDADSYAKSCYRKNHPLYQDLIHTFSKEILDEQEEISKQKLAQIVFSDEEKRKELNELVHPYVKDGLLNFFKINKDKKTVFAEVPLLYEVGWENLFDEVLLVACEDEIALERLQEYRNFTREEALKRLAAQIDKMEQIEKANTVINNNGTIVELNELLDKMIKVEKWN